MAGNDKDGSRPKKERFTGRADQGADRTLIVGCSQRGAAGSGPQLRPVRRDGWTPKKRKLFMETLAATCNVSEAARVAGTNLSTAYYQKKRDPAFAKDWNDALTVGFDELKALLLRQSLFGAEEEEVTLDGEGQVKSRKIKRAHPHMIAMRLITSHAQEVAQTRKGEQTARPDGDDAVERLRVALAEVRRRGGAG